MEVHCSTWKIVALEEPAARLGGPPRLGDRSRVSAPGDRDAASAAVCRVPINERRATLPAHRSDRRLGDARRILRDPLDTTHDLGPATLVAGGFATTRPSTSP